MQAVVLPVSDILPGMSPTYNAVKLPEHIKTVLITGAGGEPIGLQLFALM